MAGTVALVPTVERRKVFEQDFEAFVARVTEGACSHLVVMFGGTTYIQGIRANRPIRLTRALAEMGVPVLFNFHRWRETDHVPAYEQGLILQSPIDWTPGLVERLTRTDLGAARGLLVASYPHPSAARLINFANANGWATLYDCRDDWEEFARVGMARWYRRSVEKYLVNNCDVSCCVSRPLQAKLQGYTDGRAVRLSPNAYDPDFLSPGYRRQCGEQVVIGYFGHLTERWFDWPALAWIAGQRPQYRFEIIGHGAPQGLEQPENVTLLGAKTHPEICEIASRWHVGIIPFQVGRLADGVDPIKIYEYFGLGLPVVSFRMPQIADYPYTETVDTREQFVAALDRARGRVCDPAVLRSFLKRNTWTVRAGQMLGWADEALEQAGCEKSFHMNTTASSCA